MLKPYNNSRPWLDFVFNASGLLDDTNNFTARILPLHHPDVDYSNTTSTAETVEWTPVNCIPPSINEFPRDFFTDEQRRNGGILIHGLIVAYVCAMLAIVCDRYFVPSLRVICKYFNVPADIAGATFMAVGTSSPELFSSVIGSFVAKGDIGIGTVVGSAVFNILGVTGASGLALGSLAVQLDWFPITRDCFVYIITVTSLVIVIHDNLVTWFEATVLLSMFVCYITLLYFNDSVRKTAFRMVKTAKFICGRGNHYRLQSIYHKTPDENSSLLTVTTAEDVKKCYTPLETSSCYYEENANHRPFSASDNCSSYSDTLDSEINDESTNADSGKKNKGDLLKTNYGLFSSNGSDSKHDGGELVASEEFCLFNVPESKWKKFAWIVMWPANALFRITIPSCTSEQNLKWFPLTFLSSIVWLGMLSYVSFWMVAYIGHTFGIPDTVAGITILAAGTSVPELVASIIVVKSGMANMALSNLIGSNIFDILFCLGLPWLVKAMLNEETHSLVINSSALTYTSLILLSNVILFYLSLLICRWRMGLRVGITALCLYAGFLVLASLYESNVFGDFNPPACVSAPT